MLAGRNSIGFNFGAPSFPRVNRLIAGGAAAILLLSAGHAAGQSPPTCIIDVPPGWTSAADATARPDGRVVAHVVALNNKDDAIALFRLEGAQTVPTAPAVPHRLLMFHSAPPGAPNGGEFDGVADGTPSCAVVVTYLDAAVKDEAEHVAGSIHCHTP